MKLVKSSFGNDINDPGAKLICIFAFLSNCYCTKLWQGVGGGGEGFEVTCFGLCHVRVIFINCLN